MPAIVLLRRAGASGGAVIRVNEDGTRMVVASNRLMFPGGVAIGYDGFIYVTTWAGQDNSMGEVVRIAAEPRSFLPIVMR